MDERKKEILEGARIAERSNASVRSRGRGCGPGFESAPRQFFQRNSIVGRSFGKRARKKPMAKVGLRWSSAIERDAGERCLRREKG